MKDLDYMTPKIVSLKRKYIIMFHEDLDKKMLMIWRRKKTNGAFSEF